MNDATRDANGTLLLPARKIPIPNSISELACNSLAQPRFAPPARWPSHDNDALSRTS